MKPVSDQSSVGTVSSAVRPILIELRAKLSDLYGGRLAGIVLYGSHARGTARSGSDLDVAMVLDGFQRSWPEIDRTGPIVADLSLKYGVTISLIPVRKVDWEENGTLLARSLHREGILVG